MTSKTPENKLQKSTNTITKTVRDAGEVMGELAGLAVNLGRAEGSLYMCKLMRKFKIGTNSIEGEAARMWKETCQRVVGGVDMEKEVSKRNVRVVVEKVESGDSKEGDCCKCQEGEAKTGGEGEGGVQGEGNQVGE